MDGQGENLLKSMVRVGIVSSVSPGSNTARVTFPDMENMVSGNLKYLKRSDVRPELYSPWVPEVGEPVLCLYIPLQDGDGFILGGI